PTAANNLGRAPLHTLASSASEDDAAARSVAALLIAAGGDVLQRDAAGNTPLHHAAAAGKAALLRYLLHGLWQQLGRDAAAFRREMRGLCNGVGLSLPAVALASEHASLAARLRRLVP